MRVPINLTGGTYQHKSRPLSAQTCRNLWPQVQGDKSVKSPYILESFFGQSLWATKTGGTDRGMFAHLGILYKVNGTKLYSVSSAGVFTERGTIAGSGRCIFTGIGSSIVIVTGGIPYVWDGATLTTVTDVDLETPNAATHLNNQIIYDGDGGRWSSSDVGDATSINALNYATAESSADDLVRAYAHNQTLYLMGDETTEPWWNSGNGNPPFDRIEQGIMNVGLGALHSAANDNDLLYMLGHDRQVHAIEGTSIAVISTPAMARQFARYTTVDDAIGWTMQINGQWFYVLTFPMESKTWIFPRGGEWFEWSSGVIGARNNANSYAYVYGKHLVGHFADGNIYELDDAVYTENGDVIVRVRDTGPVYGELLGAAGKSLTMNSFELFLETGVGLLSGQGLDPVVMLSFSDDGGRTFSTEQWGGIGRQGQYQYKVEWFGLGTFEERIIRISMSDPVYYSIHSAAAEIEVGI